MTHEQFVKAQDVYEEQCFVLQVTGILEGWKDDKGHVRNLAMICAHSDTCYEKGEIYGESEGYSSELQKRLIKVCNDYFAELQKEFEEI